MTPKKFIKDIGIIASTQFLTAIEGIIILPVITKLMGVENYGIWSQMQVTISLAISFLTFGLPYSLVRFLAGEKDPSKIRDGVWSSLAITAAASFAALLALVFFADPMSQLFGKDSGFVYLTAFILFFSCLNEVLFNAFRAFQQTSTYAFFFMLQVFGEIGMVILTVLYTGNLVDAFFSLLAARSVVFIAMAITIAKKIGLTAPRFAGLRNYLAFGLPTIPSNISTWIVQSSNRYLIGALMGTVFVGYFTPASMISSSITLLIAPLSFVLPAALSRFYEENRIDEIKKYLSYSLKYFLAIGIPAVFGLSVISKQILELFSTADIAGHSWKIMPLLAICILFYGIHAIASQIMVVKKRTDILGKIWIFAAIINFSLNIALIPSMGIMGAAIANLAAYAIVLAITCHYARKTMPFKVDFLFIFKTTAASTVMMVIVLLIPDDNPAAIITKIVAGTAIYGTLILWFKGFNKNEISFFKKLLRKDH